MSDQGYGPNLSDFFQDKREQRQADEAYDVALEKAKKTSTKPCVCRHCLRMADDPVTHRCER